MAAHWSSQIWDIADHVLQLVTRWSLETWNIANHVMQLVMGVSQILTDAQWGAGWHPLLAAPHHLQWLILQGRYWWCWLAAAQVRNVSFAVQTIVIGSRHRHAYIISWKDALHRLILEVIDTYGWLTVYINWNSQLAGTTGLYKSMYLPNFHVHFC